MLGGIGAGGEGLVWGWLVAGRLAHTSRISRTVVWSLSGAAIIALQAVLLGVFEGPLLFSLGFAWGLLANFTWHQRLSRRGM